MAAPSQTSPNQASEATTTVAAVEKDAAPKEPEETNAPPTETEAPSTRRTKTSKGSGAVQESSSGTTNRRRIDISEYANFQCSVYCQGTTQGRTI